MVKSILRKNNKKGTKFKRKHTKRVHFNKHKQVKTFKRHQKIKKSKKSHSNKRKTINKNRLTIKGKRSKYRKRNKTIKKRRMLKMKGGSGGNLMGQKITGIPLNPQDYQYPADTNLNTSVPYPYSGQKGGSLWDTFGLGDVPILKNNVINAGKNLITGIRGGELVPSANPIDQPHATTSQNVVPKPIDINKMHSDSLVEVSEIK
jgi:hypothetical protein